jgi:hypothetical protein
MLHKQKMAHHEMLLEKHEINENKTVIPRIKYGAGSAKPVLEVFNRGAGIQ